MLNLPDLPAVAGLPTSDELFARLDLLQVRCSKLNDRLGTLEDVFALARADSRKHAIELADRIASVTQFLERAKAAERRKELPSLSVNASLALEVAALEDAGWQIISSLLFRADATEARGVQMDAIRVQARTREHFTAVETGGSGVEVFLRCAKELTALTRV